MDASTDVETAGEQPAPTRAPMTDAARAQASALVREVVGLVDSGELDATPAERAHLVGAADALDRLG